MTTRLKSENLEMYQTASRQPYLEFLGHRRGDTVVENMPEAASPKQVAERLNAWSAADFDPDAS